VLHVRIGEPIPAERFQLTVPAEYRVWDDIAKKGFIVAPDGSWQDERLAGRPTASGSAPTRPLPPSRGASRSDPGRVCRLERLAGQWRGGTGRGGPRAARLAAAARRALAPIRTEKRVTRKRRAAGLPELLVVIGVLGLLLSLVLAGIQRARGAAVRVECQARLGQIGKALHLYHHDHGALPVPENSRMSGRVSWMVFLLPYIDQRTLWMQTEELFRDPAQPKNPYVNPPHVGLTTPIRLYTCPADSRLGTPLQDLDGNWAAYTSYLGVAGSGQFRRTAPGTPIMPDGVLGQEPGIAFAQILDGLSNTIAVGERLPPDVLLAAHWYPDPVRLSAYHGYVTGPNEAIQIDAPMKDDRDPCQGKVRFGPGRLSNPCDRFHFWSLHGGGSHFLFANASVRFLAYSAGDLLPALASRDGGEAVTLPD
jgi:type II secretory pathway pseudopilin PulG